MIHASCEKIRKKHEVRSGVAGVTAVAVAVLVLSKPLFHQSHHNDDTNALTMH